VDHPDLCGVALQLLLKFILRFQRDPRRGGLEQMVKSMMRIAVVVFGKNMNIIWS